MSYVFRVLVSSVLFFGLLSPVDARPLEDILPFGRPDGLRSWPLPTPQGLSSLTVQTSGVDPDFTYTQLTNTTGSASPFSQAMTPDARYVALSANANFTGGNADGSPEIFLYDTTTGTFQQLTSLPAGRDALFPLISDDGLRIVFSSNAELVAGGNPDGRYEIYLYDRATSTLQQLTNSPRSAFAGSVTPDGTKIAVDSNGNLDPLGTNSEGVGEVFLIDTAAGTTRQLTNSSDPALDNIAHPTISADGRRVAFVTSSDDYWPNPEHSSEAAWVDTQTLQVTPITTTTFCPTTSGSSPCEARGTSISRDGTHVAFLSNADLLPAIGNPDGSFELFIVDLATHALRQPTQYSFGPANPGLQEIFPNDDGTIVAFSSTGDFNQAVGNPDGNLEIFVFDDNTDRITQVTKTAQGTFQSNDFPALTPDGQTVLFRSDRNLDLSVGNADGNLELFMARPANQPPFLNPIGPRNGTEGQLLTFQVTATDPNGTFPSLTVTNPPPGATLVDHGDGTATFTWTPTFQQADSYSLEFKASDGALADTEDVAIYVEEGRRQGGLSKAKFRASFGTKFNTDHFTIDGILAPDPLGDSIAPPLEDVTVVVSDADGSRFEETLPAGAFVTTRAGRFVFQAPLPKLTRLTRITAVRRRDLATFHVVARATQFTLAGIDTPPVMVQLVIGDDEAQVTLPCVVRYGANGRLARLSCSAATP